MKYPAALLLSPSAENFHRRSRKKSARLPIFPFAGARERSRNRKPRARAIVCQDGNDEESAQLDLLLPGATTPIVYKCQKESAQARESKCAGKRCSRGTFLHSAEIIADDRVSRCDFFLFLFFFCNWIGGGVMVRCYIVALGMYFLRGLIACFVLT